MKRAFTYLLLIIIATITTFALPNSWFIIRTFCFVFVTGVGLLLVANWDALISRLLKFQYILGSGFRRRREMQVLASQIKAALLKSSLPEKVTGGGLLLDLLEENCVDVKSYWPTATLIENIEESLTKLTLTLWRVETVVLFHVKLTVKQDSSMIDWRSVLGPLFLAFRAVGVAKVMKQLLVVMPLGRKSPGLSLSSLRMHESIKFLLVVIENITGIKQRITLLYQLDQSLREMACNVTDGIGQLVNQENRKSSCDFLQPIIGQLRNSLFDTLKVKSVMSQGLSVVDSWSNSVNAAVSLSCINSSISNLWTKSDGPELCSLMMAVPDTLTMPNGVIAVSECAMLESPTSILVNIDKEICLVGSSQRRFRSRMINNAGLVAAIITVGIAGIWIYDYFRVQQIMLSLPKITIHDGVTDEVVGAEVQLEALTSEISSWESNRLPSWLFSPASEYRIRNLLALKREYRQIYEVSEGMVLESHLVRTIDLLKDMAAPRLRWTYVRFLLQRCAVYREILGNGNVKNTLTTSPDFSFLEGQVNDLDRYGSSLSAHFRHYMQWLDDDNKLHGIYTQDHARLLTLMTQGVADLSWLEAAATNNTPSLTSVAVNNGVSHGTDWDKFAPDSKYFPDTNRNLKHMLKLLEVELGKDVEFVGLKLALENEYHAGYLQAWRDSLRAVAMPRATVVPMEDLHNYAGHLGGDSSLYTQALYAATQALQPEIMATSSTFAERKWMREVQRLNSLLSYSRVSEVSEDAGYWRRMVLFLEQAGAWYHLEKSRTADTILANFGDKRLMSALQEYQQGVRRMVAATENVETAYQFSKEIFSSVNNQMSVPVTTVKEQMATLSSISRLLGEGTDQEPVPISLLAAQSRELWRIILMQTSLYLQDRWRQEVVAEVEKLGAWERANVIAGKQGKISEYFQSYLAPFVVRNESGIIALRSVWNENVSLANAVLDIASEVMNDSAKPRDIYIVNVSALPTNADKNASLQPFATHLRMRCGGEYQELANYNYPSSISMSWRPQECDQVIIEIDVGDRQLKWDYDGAFSFMEFLQDFSAHERRFSASDFPEHADWLHTKKIRKISVRFRLSGIEPILRLVRTASLTLPDNVTEFGGLK